MRINSFISILVCLALVLAGINNASAYEPLTSPVAITGEGTLPLTPGPLLDDFEKASGLNSWNTVTGTFSKIDPPPADAICITSYTNDPNVTFGGTGYSLKLDYNVSATETFAGYYSKLDGADLSFYTYLSFWVKGAAGGEFFKVELKNNSTFQHWDPDPANPTHYYRNQAAVYITDYLDGGVTAAWQKVAIPLDAFANLDSWDSMKEFVITLNPSCQGLQR